MRSGLVVLALAFLGLASAAYGEDTEPVESERAAPPKGDVIRPPVVPDRMTLPAPTVKDDIKKPPPSVPPAPEAHDTPRIPPAERKDPTPPPHSSREGGD